MPPHSTPPAGSKGSYSRSQFMVIKIPVLGEEDDRFHQREERIDEALKAKGLGAVLGWGDSLDVQGGRSRRVAYTRVDLDVVDIDAARTELQAVLPVIGAPPGTELHYDRDSSRLIDVYASPEWRLALPAPYAAGRK